MAGEDGLSKREVLERLTAELRNLGPDPNEPEFKRWRASANSTMSEFFGSRHRLTLGLRDVTFTPDFGRGRARALSLLKSASSLATAEPKSAAAPVQSVPNAVTHSAAAAVESTHATILRRIGRKRASSEGHPIAFEATTEATPDPSAAVEPIAAVETDVTREPQETEDTIGLPVPETMADLVPEATAPKRTNLLRRFSRKPDLIGKSATIPTEGELPGEDALLGATAESAPVVETSLPEQPDAVIVAAVEGASDSTDAVREALTTRPRRSIAQSRATPWPETAEPPKVPDAVERRREAISRDFEISTTARANAPEFDASWTAPTTVPEVDTSWSAPLVRHGPRWVPQKRSPRPKHGLRRLVSAPLLVVLGLGVGVAVWLWPFGGWSTMSALGASTITNSGAATSGPTTTNPGAYARVIDASGDPRAGYIDKVVQAGIVRLTLNKAGEVTFLPAKPVKRGEFLVWLDRVRQIPTGNRTEPDTFYHDLDPPLRYIALDAYEQRILVEWPSGDAKLAFDPADPILARDAEAWTARMIIRFLPGPALESVLGITEADVLDLRARISSLKSQELAKIVQGFRLRPEAGWAKAESISRSEAAEFLMRVKAAFDRYLPTS